MIGDEDWGDPSGLTSLANIIFYSKNSKEVIQRRVDLKNDFNDTIIINKYL